MEFTLIALSFRSALLLGLYFRIRWQPPWIPRWLPPWLSMHLLQTWFLSLLHIFLPLLSNVRYLWEICRSWYKNWSSEATSKRNHLSQSMWGNTELCLKPNLWTVLQFILYFVSTVLPSMARRPDDRRERPGLPLWESYVDTCCLDVFPPFFSTKTALNNKLSSFSQEHAPSRTD